jgi:DNA-binding response OmpR family regulator
VRYVLIIEDHQESCSALKRLLEIKHFRAECVTSLKEGKKTLAEKQAEGNPFHLVLADLCLPDSDARATLDWLRSLEIPTRAMSGIDDPDIIEYAASLGVKLIAKATSPEGILESVFYAFLERKPDRDAARQIANVRKNQREIQASVPVHMDRPVLCLPS